MQKEVIGDYEVLASVHVGEKEVVIGEKEANNDGLRFMCGYMERTDIFNLCNECVYSDDYIEIAHLFGSRIREAAELFQNKDKELGIPVVCGYSLFAENNIIKALVFKLCQRV